MNVNSINSIRVSSNKLNSNSNKYTADTSFTAKKFPSGYYSNWFVELLQDKSKLASHEFESWVFVHMENFKAARKKARGFFSIESVKGDVSVREADIRGLREDLLKKEIPTVKPENFDLPHGSFSSYNDSCRQTDSTTYWFMNPEYAKNGSLIDYTQSNF